MYVICCASEVFGMKDSFQPTHLFHGIVSNHNAIKVDHLKRKKLL